jgi:hypothetical protein
MMTPPIYSTSTAAATTYASDTFTRADSALTLGTSSGGGIWTAQLGTWGISGNRAYCPVPAAGFNHATLPAVTSDGVLTIDVIIPGGATVVECGVLVRWQDAANFVLLDMALGITHLYVRVAGVFTRIDTAEAANNNPSVIAGATVPVSMTMRNSALTVTVGGAVMGGTMPPTLTAATGCGLVVANNADATGVRWDNLSYESV